MRFAFPSTAIGFVSFIEFDGVLLLGVNLLTDHAGLPVPRPTVAEITVALEAEVAPSSHRYLGFRFANVTRWCNRVNLAHLLMEHGEGGEQRFLGDRLS